MATYVSQYSTTGFCMLTFIFTFPVWKRWSVIKPSSLKKWNVFSPTDRAPVSKGLMGALFITCTAIHVPLLSHLRLYLICQLPNTFTSGEVFPSSAQKASMCEEGESFSLHSLLLTGVEVVYITNSLSRNKRFNLCSIAYILLQVIPFFCRK